MLKNKKALEMSFTFIFSIVAGAVILFLAIFLASKLISTIQVKNDQQTSAQLSILLDPLETSLESGISRDLLFSSEITIYNDKCSAYGNFGEQLIGVSSSSFGREASPSDRKPQYDKYIFSEEVEQGKEFYIFSKPFKMPFKISDLIIVLSKDYCFVNAPEDIEDEMHGLGIYRLNFTDNREACPKGSKMVCFSGAFGCDINVHGDLESGFVSKQESNLYYTGSLIYPAIFSSPEVYECNIKRLMLRISSLCSIYQDKIRIMQKRGIESVLDSHLMQLSSLAKNLKSSQGLGTIKEKADEIEKINMAENLYES